MPSPKQKKSSTPASPRVPSKLSNRRSKVQKKMTKPKKKTTKQKVGKTTLKINKSKNPEKPTNETLSHLFKTYDWTKFDTTIPRIPNPQETWEQAFKPFIPDSVTRLRHLNTKNLEGAGKHSPYKPYHVMVGYQGNKDEPKACQVAVLALYPGITLGEAQKATELLVEKLPKSHYKGGQKPYNLELRMTIRFHFIKIEQDESYINRLSAPGKEPVKLPPNKNRRGAAICRAIAEHLEVSEPFVKKCYRGWQDEQGRPKKNHLRE